MQRDFADLSLETLPALHMDDAVLDGACAGLPAAGAARVRQDGIGLLHHVEHVYNSGIRLP